MPNPSFILPLLLQSALLPFAVAVAALLALRALRLPHWAALMAVALGFLVSYGAIYHGQWSWWPVQALDWIAPCVVLGAGAIMVVERATSTNLRRVGRLLIAVLFVALPLGSALMGASGLKAWWVVAVAGALMFVAWSYLAATLAQRQTAPLTLAIVAGGAALAMMLDASQLIGQLSGALATVLLTCLLINIGGTRVAFSAAACGLAVLILGTLLATAYLYASFPLSYVALLAAALLADPLVAAITRWRGRGDGLAAWLATGALAGAPVLATVVLAAMAMQESGGY